MYTEPVRIDEDSRKAYALMKEQLAALVHGVPNTVTNLSNASALLNLFLKVFPYMPTLKKDFLRLR